MLTRLIVAPLQLLLCGQTQGVTHKARPNPKANIKEEAPRVEAPQAVLKLVVRKLLIQNQAAAVTKASAAAAAAARLPTSGESSRPTQVVCH